jgi:hypothetical protein
LKKYGKWVEFPKTGRGGRPKKPALLPDKDLKYAQVVKNKQGRKLQNIEQRVIGSLLFRVGNLHPFSKC